MDYFEPFPYDYCFFSCEDIVLLFYMFLLDQHMILGFWQEIRLWRLVVFTLLWTPDCSLVVDLIIWNISLEAYRHYFW